MVPPRARADRGKAPAVESALSRPPRGRARGTGITIGERHPRTGSMGQVYYTEEPVYEDPTEEDEPVEAEARPGPSRRQPTPDPQMQTVLGLISGLAQTVADQQRVLTRLLEREQPTIPRGRSAGSVEGQGDRGFEARETPTVPVRGFEPRAATRESPAVAPDRYRPAEEYARRTPGPHRAFQEPVGRGLDMKTFHHFQPPTFGGEHDYSVVDSWIFGIEQIFEYMECREELKVFYATSMLRGPALNWWRSESQTVPGGWRRLTWEHFLDRFTRRYIPTSEHSRRASEFQSLAQGKMTVEEYDQKFQALSRFMEWAQLGTEAAARKF